MLFDNREGLVLLWYIDGGVLNLAWIDSAPYSPSLHPSILPKWTVCMSTMMIGGAGFSTDGNKGITMKQQGIQLKASN